MKENIQMTIAAALAVGAIWGGILGSLVTQCFNNTPKLDGANLYKIQEVGKKYYSIHEHTHEEYVKQRRRAFYGD